MRAQKTNGEHMAQVHLLKPMFSKPAETIERKRMRINILPDKHQRKHAEDQLPPAETTTRFLIHTRNDTRVILFDDVLYCVADSNYTKIYLRDGSRLIVSKTLKAVEILLRQSNFLRIHASNLINLHCIKRILKTHGCAVELPDHVILDVSRSRRNALMRRMENL